MAFLDFKHVKKHFEEQGCKLLEKEYVGAHAKMRYVCSCGNESSINWNNFKNGKRCGCGRKGMGRLPEDEIKKEVESIGFEFISNKYINRYNIVTCRVQVWQYKNM